MARGDGALLFGRRTYEDLLSFWNTQSDNPFTPALNNTPKYVASTTLTERLPWPNSTLLRGEAPDAEADLKQQQPDMSFGIMWSRILIHALMRRDLVDEWLLMVYPIVLGTGFRLFDSEAPPTRLTLSDSLNTTTGVIIATYRTIGRLA